MTDPGRRWRRGLVIGKFLPPHAGHSHLITTARRQVESLDVVVCDRPDQEIPGATRAAWLAELHPDCRVLVVDDICDDDNSEAWARYTLEFLEAGPDVVFTSEVYGDAYAFHLGCDHVLVDATRAAQPVSGTAVRTAPARHWHQLAPVVRAGLTRRICVVGAESTGTTTLARALADHCGTVWVPEYGREFAEAKLASAGCYRWSTDEFTEIALGQQSREDIAARAAGPLLICDTDALATAIWHERYLGFRSPAVEALARSRRYTAYLLTDCDIPFVQDGTRDGEHIRRWMTDRFAQELAARPEPWLLVSGDPDARLKAAAAFVDGVVGPGWISAPA